MSITRTGAGLLVAISVAAGLATLSCATAKQETAAAPKPDPVARGRYLVTITGCNDCHTPGSFWSAGALPAAARVGRAEGGSAAQQAVDRTGLRHPRWRRESHHAERRATSAAKRGANGETAAAFSA